MMDNYQTNEDLLLDEVITTPKFIWYLMGVIAAASVTGALTGGKEFSWLVMAVVLALVVLFGLILLLVYFLFMRRMHLRMDAARVWTHIPLTPDRSLAWEAIHTAAIVQLDGMDYPAMIVLSVLYPEEALTRKRMIWKNPRRGEELRFPLTDSRRAVIEQCLRMQLPEITL